jgi:hypothetical protein
VDGICVGCHRQVRDQLPDNGRSAHRRVKVLGMDDLKALMWIFLLLSDWRTNRHCRVSDLQIKERALERTAPITTKPGRFRPTDKLLAFLEAL